MGAKRACFRYTDLTKKEHQALKSISKGEADEYQQRLALAVIVNKLSRAHNTLYIPDSFDQSAFLSGRAFVGHEILKVLQIPVGQLQNKVEEDEEV